MPSLLTYLSKIVPGLIIGGIIARLGTGSLLIASLGALAGGLISYIAADVAHFKRGVSTAW